MSYSQCRDVRTREVGIQEIHHRVRPYSVGPCALLHTLLHIDAEVELIRRDYAANGGWETFLSYEDPELDILSFDVGSPMFFFTILLLMKFERP